MASRRYARWELQIVFLRAIPGKEARVVEDIRSSGGPGTLHYRSLGVSDIVQLMPSEGLDARIEHCTHPSVLQTNVLPVFPWDHEDTPNGLMDSIAQAPCVLLILAKINPRILLSLFPDSEVQCAAYLADALRARGARVFSTFAHSELLVILPGTGFDTLMSEFSQFRKEFSVNRVFTALPETSMLASLSAEPVLARTYTIPLVSYEQVILRDNYEALTGDVNPMTLVMCSPTEDDRVLTTVPPEIFAVREFWGEFDIALQGEGIPLKEFVPLLTGFREQLSRPTGLYSTCTFMLGDVKTMDTDPSGAATQVTTSSELDRTIQEQMDQLDLIVRGILEHKGLVDRADDWVRLHAVGFLSKLRNCIADPLIGLDYLDMAEFLLWLQSQIELLDDAELSHTERISIQERCVHAITLATQALYHRSADIEAHMQGVTYPSLWPVVGSNRVARALGDIPRFVIHDIFSEEREEQELEGRKWYGFATHGLAYEFRHYPGEIITYPTRAILQPLKEWHVVTHELSHLYFHIAGPKKKLEDLLLRDEYRAQRQRAKTDSIVMGQAGFMEELFAHWFDYSYFYERNLDLFLRCIWSTWLETPIVWQDKRQYLIRTLLISLLHNHRASITTQLSMRSRTISQELTRLIRFLSGELERFSAFEMGVRETGAKNVIGNEAGQWLFLMALFETHFWNTDLYDKINKPYAELDDHVAQIRDGRPVSQGVTNPKALYWNLMQSVSDTELAEANMPLTLALISTLSSDYQRRIWE